MTRLSKVLGILGDLILMVALAISSGFDEIPFHQLWPTFLHTPRLWFASGVIVVLTVIGVKGRLDLQKEREK